MNKKTRTIDSYNNSAKALADKFDNQGARVSDIQKVFALMDKKNPKVLEIGCGNGRDAEEILKYTDDYLGIDISEGLIDLAREKVPHGIFEVDDIEEYTFSSDIDVIFAFASLLHVDKAHLEKVLERAFEALSPGGIFRISLKHSLAYEEIEKNDEFGTRTFYLYSKEDIEELSKGFKILNHEIMDIREQRWIEVTLQK